jgi:type IV secretion system protein VirB9
VRFPRSRKAALPTTLFCSLALASSAQAADGVSPPTTTPSASSLKIPKGRYVAAVARPTPPALSGGEDEPIARANAVARMQPAPDGFLNAIQRFPWSEGALYQVYAAPGQVTDIALQPGEELTGAGPVAAGDTARWIIGDTESGAGDTKRVHILIKPIARGLTTNLVINTNRRTYHLELRATATTYMAAVSWLYPQDELIALKAKAAPVIVAAAPAAPFDIAALNFNYRIVGDRPAWRPERVFDDGRQTFIAFPLQVRQGELPPIYALGSAGSVELLNFRIQGSYAVVDRVFDLAELRLGDKRGAKVVRIIRQTPRDQR